MFRRTLTPTQLKLHNSLALLSQTVCQNNFYFFWESTQRSLVRCIQVCVARETGFKLENAFHSIKRLKREAFSGLFELASRNSCRNRFKIVLTDFNACSVATFITQVAFLEVFFEQIQYDEPLQYSLFGEAILFRFIQPQGILQ